MRSHSALARLQQAITLLLLCSALGWLSWYWRRSPLVAIAGFLAIAMSYSAFLAVEFLALRLISRGDSAPRPGWAELARAWLRETMVAPLVFCWWQPFRWRNLPDRLDAASFQPGRRGVVLIHGFVCNRGFWTPWLKALGAGGYPFIAVNLEPVFGSIDDYVPIIEQAVRRVTEVTGMPPVLVCHSMGGLAARAWLRESADARIHHVVTIGSPHQGTWLARFSGMTNGRQMRKHSEWLRQLRESEGKNRNARFTCWYSNCDNIAFPTSTATLSGADNRLVRGAAHVDLGFHHRVMNETLAMIAATQHPKSAATSNRGGSEPDR